MMDNFPISPKRRMIGKMIIMYPAELLLFKLPLRRTLVRSALYSSNLLVHMPIGILYLHIQIKCLVQLSLTSRNIQTINFIRQRTLQSLSL